MFNRPRCRLQVLKGDVPSHDLAVSHSPFTIGSDAQCDLILSDSSVRPQHAVLEEDESDGSWTLRNSGQRGVLVNQQSVTTVPLRDGDTIQIGAATLLSFHVVEAASKTPAGAGATAPPAVNPVLLVVFGAVVLLSVAFLFLAPKSQEATADRTALTPDLMEELLAKTDACLRGEKLEDFRGEKLKNTSPVIRVESYAKPMVRVDGTSESAARFFVLMALRQRSVDADKVNDWIDQQLLAPARQQFTQAWLLESQGRLAEARQAYRRLTEALPDPRCMVAGVAGYAAFRQAALTDQIAAQQRGD